jgi:hypothetical protein
MLAARIYGLLWLLVMSAAVAVYLTDSFSFGTTMILGFIASILAGTGILTVYPALMHEEISARSKASKETRQRNSSKGVLQKAG